MKVHFASGGHPFRGWTNVDALDFPGVDLKINLLEDFPEEVSGIEMSYVGHFLEHLTHEECVTFLTRVRERMLPGGQLFIVGPDVEKATIWYNSGSMDEDLFRAVKKHGEIPADEPWNRHGVHVWDCTGDVVVDLCKQAGWSDAEEIPIHKMSGPPMIDSSAWQFCVVASA